MRDHSHTPSDDSEHCVHCGQVLHAATPAYGRRGPNRVGIAVTVLLHLLLVAIYLFQRGHPEKHAALPSGASIVYLSPLPGKPKPKQQQRKQAPKTAVKSAPLKVRRLPNTITLPDEKPVPVVEAEPKKAAPPAETDMSAYIEARRRQRGAAQARSDQPAEESEADRGKRIANANIAAANGRSRGADPNESGGVFSISDKTFHSAELKFRGWNPNFQRRWLTQVTVEQGGEVDLETAIVKKMIELIRKEKSGDFDWDSHRLQRVVKMSARIQDTAELQAFLYKEMFPEYKPAGR